MRNTMGSLIIAAVLAIAGLATIAPAPSSAGVSSGGSSATGVKFPTSPAGDPPGANHWKCRPTAKRPYPVILVHGTFGDRKNLLEKLSRRVKRAGFCVYSLDYGNRGTGEIKRSAHQLKRFTHRVLRATGARKVSMIGHSQGGMMPRYYIKFLGGAKVVGDLIGFSPSNHGTKITGSGSNPISDLAPGVSCRACSQQAAGSHFLKHLNRGDETPGRVSYTQVTTRYDEVVVPYRSAYLEPGPRTTNITLQDKCPRVVVDHVFIPRSTPAIDLALNALKHHGPARKSFQPRCS